MRPMTERELLSVLENPKAHNSEIRDVMERFLDSLDFHDARRALEKCWPGYSSEDD